jgi:hypothetical protein
MADENERLGEHGKEKEPEGEEFSGWDELLYSLGQALQGKEGKAAMTTPQPPRSFCGSAMRRRGGNAIKME